MKEWLTAKELAAEALPNFPKTQQGIDALVTREGWDENSAYARARSGRGGGTEYHYRLLPTLAQVTYMHRHMLVSASSDNECPTASDLGNANLSERAQIERDARLVIVNNFNNYASGLRNANLAAQMQLFVDNYNANRIIVDEWVRGTITSLSKRSLMRWRQSVSKGQLSKLALDPSKARKGSGLLETANNGKVKGFILALIAQQPQIAAERVQVLTADEFGGALTDRHGNTKPLPPLRTFQHAIRAFKDGEKVVLTRLSNPDLYRSTMAPSGTNSLRHVVRPNQLWMIDASPLDAFDMTASRPTIYACIDIATRRTILYLSRTPRAEAVALLMRKAILKLGVPETVKTDNGSDFVAEASKRLFATLDIELSLSNAYSPQEKGHVERVIGTMQRHFAEMLPGYAGHNVADRKRLEDRVGFAKRLGAETAELFGISFTLADIQARAEDWIDVHYDNRVHSSLNGKTPKQMAEASAATIRTVSERALDVLLMPVAGKDGFRTVTKMGVSVNDAKYQTFNALPGDRVFVRMDPNNMGRILLFDADTKRFIEEAVCPELAGIDPADFMKTVKAHRTELLNERGAEVRKQVKQLTSGAPMIDRYLRQRRKDVADSAPNVVRIPQRHIEHTTPELTAAMHAATGEKPVEKENANSLKFTTETAEVVSFTPKPGAPGVRPVFRTDEDMAAWLLANPTKVADRDRTFMVERLKSWSFQQLLIGRGIDPDELKIMVTPLRKTEEAK